MSGSSHSPAAASSFIPDIRVPTAWTLGGLAAGLVLGILLAAALSGLAAKRKWQAMERRLKEDEAA